MRDKFRREISVVVVIMSIICSFIPSVAAEPVDVEIISITIESGVGRKVYAKTRTCANIDSLPELNEYICIFGEDNHLKSVTVFQAETDGSETDVLIENMFDISTDYIKIFAWDKDMKPYSSGIAVPIKSINIEKHSGGVDGAGSGGVSIGAPIQGICPDSDTNSI